MSKNQNRVMTEADFANDFTPQQFDGFRTKSAEIRARAAAGQSRSQIAKDMVLRYQHVRNVLTQTPKKS